MILQVGFIVRAKQPKANHNQLYLSPAQGKITTTNLLKIKLQSGQESFQNPITASASINKVLNHVYYKCLIPYIFNPERL